MDDASAQRLGAKLREVSRSFYLTLRVLPGAIRPQIGLAYLLARTTDTIADTELVPLERRLGALQSLSNRIQGRSGERLDFSDLAQSQATESERALLGDCETSLGWLGGLEPGDRELVRAVLDTISGGQELDLRRFAQASRDRVLALESDEELDDYTYRVAGCVGEFWTRMCRAHVFPDARLDESALLRDGVRFGKGLQLINILRDLPNDLRQGRCYLPRPALAGQGLKLEDLLKPENEGRLRPVYDGWLDRAADHLAAGWRYTLALPRRCMRVRLACSWPLLIGRDTLLLLRARPVLDPAKRIKITRAQVRGIMLRSVFFYPFPRAWAKLFAS